MLNTVSNHQLFSRRWPFVDSTVTPQRFWAHPRHVCLSSSVYFFSTTSQLSFLLFLLLWISCSACCRELQFSSLMKSAFHLLLPSEACVGVSMLGPVWLWAAETQFESPWLAGEARGGTAVVSGAQGSQGVKPGRRLLLSPHHQFLSKSSP